MTTPTLPDVGSDHRRVIPLFAVHNFRDLGGYPTVDGRTTRWNRVFRSDGLNRLTVADVEALRPLGLRTVIDLRTQAEIDDHGRFPFETYPVSFHHHSIVDQTWSLEGRNADGDPHEFLVQAYVDMLASGADRIAASLRILADPANIPAVFHCAAGKDRTGLVAALLLGALGVPDDFIVADFALTGPAMARTRAWAADHRPELLARFNSAPAGFMVALPSAMAEILDRLHSRHGSIVGYLATIGIGDDVVAQLRDHLLTQEASTD